MSAFVNNAEYRTSTNTHKVIVYRILCTADDCFKRAALQVKLSYYVIYAVALTSFL